MNTKRRTIVTSLSALLLFLALFLGCSANSPTDPDQGDGDGGGGVITGRWSLSVSTSPNSIPAGGERSTISIEVTNKDSGDPPPNGSLAVVTTDLGMLGDPVNGVNALSLATYKGRAEVDLYSGDEEGTADLVISFGKATKKTSVTFTDAIFLFLESITPASGPADGGYSATIRGTGFNSKLRVIFSQGIGYAEVLSVSPDAVRVRVPPYDGQLYEEEEDLSDVKVELYNTNGNGGPTVTATDTLPDAFTYFGTEPPPP